MLNRRNHNLRLNVEISVVPPTAEVPTNGATSDTPGKPLPSLQKLIGQLRDCVIGLAGFMYLSGYVVWALHANEYGLGTLPLIQSQYVCAGLIPTILMVAALCVISVLKLANVRIVAMLASSDAARKAKWCRIVKRTFLVLGMSLVSAFVQLRLTHAVQVSVVVLVLFALVGALFPTFLWAKAEASNTEWQYDIMDWVATSYVPLALAALALSVYQGVFFSWIPQEMGGGRPRIAVLT